ncbi:uncharacterized protein BJ171DRAFT_538058 [Polychytrium aggregatum]|uniref:uncharacterized protein n=1 Tax=Polychytrium aggregatum TaxID=110093 RepID=UPI0022FF3CBD|nr:uncharacterized protein BJ171DRAFT_538058 [Polychytrium aggregatum]KAI9192921.1 hypothetical protein BJ171DRAFT_538058 [Polychytrium aggregatum]
MSAPQREILLGIDTISKDGIKNSPVLLWTLRQFVRPGDTIHLVHASKSLATPALAGGHVTDNMSSDVLRDMERTVEDVVHQALPLYLSAEVAKSIQLRVTIQKGDPRDALLRLSESASVVAIVVGSRGIGAFQRALQGSVSDHLAHNSSTSVIIVKTDD